MTDTARPEASNAPEQAADPTSEPAEGAPTYRYSAALAAEIEAAESTKRLEDLYLPFKPKKQTLATVARERGLEPLADEGLAASPSCAALDAPAAQFATTHRRVPRQAAYPPGLHVGVVRVARPLSCPQSEVPTRHARAARVAVPTP